MARPKELRVFRWMAAVGAFGAASVFGLGAQTARAGLPIAGVLAPAVGAGTVAADADARRPAQGSGGANRSGVGKSGGASSPGSSSRGSSGSANKSSGGSKDSGGGARSSGASRGGPSSDARRPGGSSGGGSRPEASGGAPSRNSNAAKAQPSRSGGRSGAEDARRPGSGSSESASSAPSDGGGAPGVRAPGSTRGPEASDSRRPGAGAEAARRPSGTEAGRQSLSKSDPTPGSAWGKAPRDRAGDSRRPGSPNEQSPNAGRDGADAANDGKGGRDGRNGRDGSDGVDRRPARADDHDGWDEGKHDKSGKGGKNGKGWGDDDWDGKKHSKHKKHHNDDWDCDWWWPSWSFCVWPSWRTWSCGSGPRVAFTAGSYWSRPLYGRGGSYWLPSGGLSVGYFDDDFSIGVGLGTSFYYGCNDYWDACYYPTYKYRCYTYPTYCWPGRWNFGYSTYYDGYYSPSSTIVVIDDDEEPLAEPLEPAAPGTASRDAFIELAAGWDHLHNGRAEAALRFFSNRSADSPRDPYAKIGYALSAAFLNDTSRATWSMRRAFRIADESLISFPLDPRLRSVVEFAESRYAFDAEQAAGRQRRDALFMLGALRFLMHDDQGAIDAACEAEGAGDDDQSLRNLIRLLELSVRSQAN